MSVCKECCGLIMEQGKCYGYAGKVCNCQPPRYVTHPMFVPQTPTLSQPSVTVEQIQKYINLHLPSNIHEHTGAAAKSVFLLLNKTNQPSEDKPCPHVYTSKDGTSHCTLAERDATELNRLRQQVEVLRGAANDAADVLAGTRYEENIKEALAEADRIAKGEA